MRKDDQGEGQVGATLKKERERERERNRYNVLVRAKAMNIDAADKDKYVSTTERKVNIL